MAVSRAPLAKLQAYKRRMGWTFPWASSLGSDFNPDFNVEFTEEQQRDGGIEYNYRRERPVAQRRGRGPKSESPLQQAAMTGTDAATYTRERPGMSAFALEEGVVYHTYSTYARGLDGLWGMYQWLDRAPKGRNETGLWWRRHDEYAQGLSASWLYEQAFRVDMDSHLGAAVRGQRHAHDRLVRVDVRDGRDADARRMDDVDGLDADARAVVVGAAASFLAMWVVMTAAMMLPSLVPMLWRYRQAVAGTGERRLAGLTALVSAGYFFVWTVFGMAIFPLGAALAVIAMQQPAMARGVPIAAGVVVLIAGSLQFTDLEGVSAGPVPGGAWTRAFPAGRCGHRLGGTGYAWGCTAAAPVPV